MGACTSSTANLVNLRCYQCRKDQIVESSEPICLDCRGRIAVPKVCKRCSEEYLALVIGRLEHGDYLTEHSTRCPACREYRKCEICGTETLKKICEECFVTGPSCTCCGTKFRDRFQLLHGERYCRRCARIVKKLVGDQPILPQRLEVTYQKRAIDHKSFYCRDAVEYDLKITEFQRIYPMTTLEIETEKYELPMKICSEQCRGRISYQIISTRLI